MLRRRIVTGDEVDAYTWRRFYCWTQKAGAVKAVKRRTHKRERKEGRAEALRQLES
jgi:hypothetical protein